MTTKPSNDEPLEDLSKQDLVVRAHALGIDGAEKFTKLELLDEIRRHQSEDRGLLGKARDLLRGVVERGIAKIAPGKKHDDAPPAAPNGEAPAEEEEDLRYSMHAIEPEAFVAPPPVEPVSVPPMLDDAPFPERYDCDECVALAVDPTTLYVYWESRPRTIDRARRAIEARGGSKDAAKSTLRILVVQPGDRAPIVETRDFEILDLSFGEYFVRDLPAGAVLRAAIGLREGEQFLPLAHTLDVEPPRALPAASLARDVAVWTERATYASEAIPADVATTLPAHLHAPPELPSIPREGVPGIDDAVEPLRDEEEIEAWRLGLSSAALQGLRARRRKRGAAGEGADAAPSPSMPRLPKKGLGASDRIGASDRLARAPSSGSWRRES